MFDTPSYWVVLLYYTEQEPNLQRGQGYQLWITFKGRRIN